MKILVTGAAGFIAGYTIEELLCSGHYVVGLDNFSKYGPIKRSFDKHPHYRFVRGNAKDTDLLKKLMADCDQVLCLAAMIGGISYFHEYAYDLIAENERIVAAAFDASIFAFKKRKLKKINVLSSSMVFENATKFPSKEGDQSKCPPPSSTYGFQKLACEYFAKGAWEQYQLPYTIIRPFNCVGIGERKALGGKRVLSGNFELALSHVVPDLAQKILKGQNPLHILGSGKQIRHYTYGGDLARGIRLCIESKKTINEDFNLSTNESSTVLELAKLMWKKVNPGKPFKYVSDPPYKYDVQKRIPDTSKAKKLLKFEAKTNLSTMLDEIIPWIKEQILIGSI